MTNKHSTSYQVLVFVHLQSFILQFFAYTSGLCRSIKWLSIVFPQLSQAFYTCSEGNTYWSFSRASQAFSILNSTYKSIFNRTLWRSKYSFILTKQFWSRILINEIFLTDQCQLLEYLKDCDFIFFSPSDEPKKAKSVDVF